MVASGGKDFPASLVLVGAGKMGGALLQAWLDQGFEGSRIRVIDPDPSPQIRGLCQARGVLFEPPPLPSEVLVLAVKPQSLDAVAPQLAAMSNVGTLVISILAGKTMADVLDRLPYARSIVRAMPNLPAAIGRGVTGAVANATATAAQRRAADVLLSVVGKVEWLENEALIDAVTAISGSGPAYVFYLTECLAEAGRAIGLPAQTAARLARATVEGAGALLAASADQTPAALRQSVTSKGGTTAAALDVLMNGDGLKPLLEKAVVAAKKRAGELSG